MTPRNTSRRRAHRLHHLGGGQRLLCLQSGAGDPLPPHWRQGATMFVTRTAGSGELGSWAEAGGTTGLAAGNATCQARAAAAGLAAPSSFVAWLSFSTTDAVDQLTQPGPWRRVDGVPIAATLADLADGRLSTASSPPAPRRGPRPPRRSVVSP